MIAAIVQARMGSSRLPGKTLALLAGKLVLQRVIERTRLIPGVDRVAIATTDLSGDDVIADYAAGTDVAVYRGSSDDVLSRYARAAEWLNADTVIRITADCPLIDPGICGEVLQRFLATPAADYASNRLERRTYPDGLDVEVMSRAALDRADREAELASEREHVTPYIYKNPDIFTLVSVVREEDLSDWRWTLDHPEDLQFLERVCRALDRYGVFTAEQVIQFVRAQPELLDINKHFVANEGYLKSLAEDRRVTPGRVRLASDHAQVTATVAPPRRVDRSQAWWRRACQVIPGGTQTISKRADQFVQGVAPVFIVRGSGSHVWDVDGYEYIDYMMALGPIVLGYDAPPVMDAIRAQLAHGIQFSLSHPLEVELAELIRDVVPCAEMVRFGKNGSDVTTGAIRLARAFTGRNLIAACGYHGWHDWYIGTTPRHAGVPHAVRELTKRFVYNDADGLERLLASSPDQFAAVILEPIHDEEPAPDFLRRVADLTRAHGALLVFDEVKTGFRFGLAGAQGYYGITPDLACFGKAIANGMPLSVLAGRREIMSRLTDVFFSFTAGGETLSLAAALATIRALRDTDALETIWQLGDALKTGYNRLAGEAGLGDVTACRGLPPMTVTRFNATPAGDGTLLRSLFQQEMLDRGVLFDDGFVLCASHSDDDVDRTLDATREALTVLRSAIADGDVRGRIRGTPIQPLLLS